MIRWPAWMALAAISVTAGASAATSTVASMAGHRRIVLITAPDRHNPGATKQRKILSSWHMQAIDRDVTLVELAGRRVTGTADPAAGLRKRYDLAPDKFVVLLIGKDGHIALRSTRPVTAQRLQSLIDAMPMRRAGER